MELHPNANSFNLFKFDFNRLPLLGNNLGPGSVEMMGSELWIINFPNGYKKSYPTPPPCHPSKTL